MATSLVHVERGDLITADLFNSIIDLLSSQDSRISALESGAAVRNAQLITGLLPPTGTVQLGSQLTVLGNNFGFIAGAVRVFIDSTRIQSFKTPGSNDQTLIFDIPTTFTDVPQVGRLATLTVSNQTTSDQRQIYLLPMAQLGNDVDVGLRGIQPDPVLAGKTATFQFLLNSRTNLAATYSITAAITGPANAQTWQNSIQIVDNQGGTSGQIPLAGGQQTTFSVVISVPQNSTDTFTLTVTAAAPGAQGSSGPITRTVGVAGPPIDTSITISSPSGQVFNAAGGAGAGTVDGAGIHLKKGDQGASVQLLVTCTNLTTYNVAIALKSGKSWDLILTTPVSSATPPQTGTFVAQTAGQLSQLVVFAVNATSGQQPSSTAIVEVTVNQVGVKASAILDIPLDVS